MALPCPLVLTVGTWSMVGSWVCCRLPSSIHFPLLLLSFSIPCSPPAPHQLCGPRHFHGWHSDGPNTHGVPCSLVCYHHRHHHRQPHNRFQQPCTWLAVGHTLCGARLPHTHLKRHWDSPVRLCLHLPVAPSSPVLEVLPGNLGHMCEPQQQGVLWVLRGYDAVPGGHSS